MKHVILSLTLLASLLAPFSSIPAMAAKIDDAKAETAGIRKLSGKRLTLYTDLTGKEIDELPAAFDQAFAQWCRYFDVDESKLADWHMTGFLMKDKARFAQAGLLPDDLPPFEHGFSRDDELWLNEQPSDYYRRHLLLHEGTHGFMFSTLGSCGPLWYMEGIAEYLATHRWHDGKLTLGYMPKSRDEVPLWGRIRLLQDAVAQRKAIRLNSVLDLKSESLHRENQLYAWCWAAASLLDRHPRYRERFRELVKIVREANFNQQFRRLFETDWQALCEEWQLMVANLEYGYDVERAGIDFTPGTTNPRPATEGTTTVQIAADRGWQNTGLRLTAGVKYRITATGRYQLAQSPKVWWCEPGGVSIRYYQGRPLGILLAAVHPDAATPDGVSALLKPTVIGLGATLSPTTTGTLFLKINDSAAELADNAGKITVHVAEIAD